MVGVNNEVFIPHMGIVLIIFTIPIGYFGSQTQIMCYCSDSIKFAIPPNRNNIISYMITKTKNCFLKLTKTEIFLNAFL